MLEWQLLSSDLEFIVPRAERSADKALGTSEPSAKVDRRLKITLESGMNGDLFEQHSTCHVAT